MILDESLALDARLSKAVYTNKKKVDGWQLDEELSNIDRGVYHKDNKAKIVFRGTDPTNKRDVGTDILVSLGLERYSSRLRNSEKTVALAIQKYGLENVSLTGHSLGGFIASQISLKNGIPATGFNTSMSPFEFTKGRKYKDFHSVSSFYDPISYFTRKFVDVKQHTIVNPKLWNPHTLFNYI